MPERAHLEQIAKSSGRRPAALDGPEFPSDAEDIWEVFLSLHNRRTHYGSDFGASPNPLQYEAILAWCNLYSVRLSCWELETIEALDAVWMQVMGERRNG